MGLVQRKHGSSSGANHVDVTLDSTPGSGSTIVVCYGTNVAGPDQTSPSGWGVTTWTLLVESSVRRSASVWAGVVDGTPSASGTCNHSAFSPGEWDVSEHDDLDISGTLYTGTNNGQGANGSASCTPGAGNAYRVIVSEGSQVSITTGPTNSFTAMYASGQSKVMACAYLDVANASGSYSSGYGTGNNYAQWDCAIVAINVAGGGATGRSPIINVNRAVQRAASW